MFSGRGMGGGSGSGGGMLRSVGRAVARVGVSGPSNAAASTTPSKANPSPRSTSPTSKFTHNPKSSSHLSVSSPLNSHNRNPLSGVPTWYSSSEDDDDNDWVSLDGTVDDGIHGFSGAYVLGPAPSEAEVDDAVTALQQMFWPASHVQPYKDNCRINNDVADHVMNSGIHVSTDGSDWEEPPLALYDSRMQLCNGSDGLYYAFHLLQTEPSVQRMVKSISSDKSVWEAVLNNKVVRELKEAFSSDEKLTDGMRVPQSSDGTSSTDCHTSTNASTNVVKWLFNTARAKFLEVVEKVTKIVNELFQQAVPKRAGDAADPFSEKLRTSFMLSIMVLLVVVVSRAHRA